MRGETRHGKESLFIPSSPLGEVKVRLLGLQKPILGGSHNGIKREEALPFMRIKACITLDALKMKESNVKKRYYYRKADDNTYLFDFREERIKYD
jgi:hypothetical protein